MMAHLTGRGSGRYDLELVATESEAGRATVGGEARGSRDFPWHESTAQLFSRDIPCGYSGRRFPLPDPCSIRSLPSLRMTYFASSIRY
jgi:hypothetical protein